MSSISALGTERFTTTRVKANRVESRGVWDSPFGKLCTVLSSVWGLLACKTVILVVSAIDIYLTVKYIEFMPELELNPVGRWLLGVDNGPRCQLQNAAAFITAKFAGNVVVLAIIEVLAHVKFRQVGFVAGAVAFFQLLLGCFLFFADSGE